MVPAWKPHDPIPVEQSWNTFISSVGGKLVSEMISQTPYFENADYLFEMKDIIIELKEVETDFGRQTGINERIKNLFDELLKREPTWKPPAFGGKDTYPNWFYRAFLDIFRKPVSRIIEKANRQIKSTKNHLQRQDAKGILLFVNDGFASLEPELVRAMAGDLLTRSYSSIDCFVYLTVNRYVAIPGSDLAYLVWSPMYSPSADGSLVAFVDWLGKSWHDYLEGIIGPFKDRIRGPEDRLPGAKSIEF